MDIRNYRKCIGVEEIIFQVKLCTSGCIKAILNEKLYNCCWFIHETFAQAVEWLCIEEDLETSSEKWMLVFVIFYNALIRKKSKSTQSTYGKSQQHEFGYIRQYWVTDGGLVDLLCKLHYVIAGNDFSLQK